MGIDFSDPWVQAAAGGIGGPMGGSIFSMFNSADANGKIMDLIKQATDQYGNINVPKLQQLVLQQLPPTAMAAIREDPQYREQQAQADAQLNDIISSGGLTLGDKAALQALSQRAGRGASAEQNAITQGMASRGTLDSGAALAAQEANAQQDSQTANSAGESQAAQAQSRALQALQLRGQEAGQNLSRKFGEDAQVAAAKDAIAQGNTAIANAANTYNTTVLPETQFGNQLGLANAKANADFKMAGAIGAQSQGENAGVGSMANVGPTMFNQILSWMHGSAGPQSQTPQAPSSSTGSTSQSLSGGTTNYGGGSGGLGDFPIGTGGGVSQAAESGQSTKGQTITSADGSSGTGAGAGGGDGGGAQAMTLSDGTVLEFAGNDANGVPTYRRHAAGGFGSGRNF